MLLPFLAGFQIAAATPTVYNGRAGNIAIVTPRSEGSVEIDGRLDEPVWRSAANLTGFSLYQPVDRRPAPDSTEVLVWYSSSALYFGIRAFEPHAPVTVSLADRDKLGANDNVEIHLDTFDERNRAFVFIVNPLGVQADGTKSEGGGFIPGANVAPGQNDLSQDFLWQSRGRVTEWGYEVEVRIPFSSLRYPSALLQRWGIQIDRHVQHSGYEETWTPAQRASSSFIAQAGYLTGLSGMEHGQIVELNPELTNTVTGTPPIAATPVGASWRYLSDPQLGGNLRWTLGSNFVLNGTAKPDFSQVEADAAQIAADARFALFYPERRPFFVEGSDQFNVPNTLIYTRRIVKPDAATKLTGKLGQTDVAILSALDDRETTSDASRPLVDIVRLRRAFGGSNTAGLVYSERVGAARQNRMAGADTRIAFGKLYFAEFQTVASATRENGVTSIGPMWEALVDRTGRNFGFHYSLIGIDRDFRTDNGFIPRAGVVQPGIFNRFTVFGKQGSLFERYNVFGSLSGVWRYDDFFSAKPLLEDKVSASNQFTFRGGWQLGFTPALSTYAFDPAAYTDLSLGPAAGGGQIGFVPAGRTTAFVTSLSLSTPVFRTFSASAGVGAGNDIDFRETSRVHRADYNASLDLRPSERLRVGATFVGSAFRRLDSNEQSESKRIPRLRAEYQLGRPLFIRVVAQYEATRRLPLRDPRTSAILWTRAPDGIFAPSTETRSNLLRADWLFSYRPAPGTVFFAGYGSSMTEADPLAFQGLRRTGDAFFVKMSYLLRANGG
jgi:Domain of unknown function (DUF5916)